MTIYIDELRHYGKLWWCHMATDSSDLSELHAMAVEIGLKRTWFQEHRRVPHYDLTSNKRELALSCGAVEVKAKELFVECSRRDGNE